MDSVMCSFSIILNLFIKRYQNSSHVSKCESGFWVLYKIRITRSAAVSHIKSACKLIRLATHVLQNIRKHSQNVKNKKCIAWYFASLFSCFMPHFLHFVFHSILHQGRHLQEKSKDFLNKTRNLNEMWKAYSEYFVFCGVCHKNTHEIPTKCELR